jgi:hypothetical protein
LISRTELGLDSFPFVAKVTSRECREFVRDLPKRVAGVDLAARTRRKRRRRETIKPMMEKSHL